MLKGHTNKFYNRVWSFCRDRFYTDSQDKYLTIEEKAYKLKKTVCDKYGAFTAETMKQYVYCGGGFFIDGGGVAVIELLAAFYTETIPEYNSYVEKYTKRYQKEIDADADNAGDFIYHQYATILVNAINKMCKDVPGVPAIEIRPAFFADNYYKPVKRKYYNAEEYGLFIFPGNYTHEYKIDRLKSAPNVRQLYRENVYLIYKNNVLYDVVKEA